MGTKLSDSVFFSQLVDTTLPGLEALPELAEAADYAACRRVFAAYVRKMLRPEVFFSSVQGADTVTEADITRAEKAVRNILISVGVEYDFGDGPIDWFSNPTYNKYNEWTWQLSRHNEWRIMGRVYRQTGDERYAAATARQIRGWIDQAQCPELPCFAGDTLCWRTIECGIRQGQTWPYVIHAFCNSPAFDDDLITDWCKSVWEHGAHLRGDHYTCNWLIMEMTGLLYIGILYPCLKDSAAWYRYALDKLLEVISEQTYNDGFQYELTTGYQIVVLQNYAYVMRLMEVYGQTVPQKIQEYMSKMLRMYVRLVRPDGKVPDINDGSNCKISGVIAGFTDLVPEDPVLRWAVSEGAEGTPPEQCGQIFADAGFAALRTGWGKEDTWLFFDGGKFGMAHQHEDKLSLLLYADSAPILTESGTYAYDTSEMRKYCLCTRGHNTVRVDGMDQNRRKGFDFDKELAAQHDLRWHLGEKTDALRASYCEGYGPEQDKSVTHERSVYFLRKAAGLRPFVVVVDRLFATSEHDYELLWHLDSQSITQNGMHLKAGTLNILPADAHKETAGLNIVYGQRFPEWQGWLCSGLQNRHRPLYTAQYWLHGQSLRFVTVLYPDNGEVCPICRVEADLCTEDTRLRLHLADGTVLELDENALWEA